MPPTDLDAMIQDVSNHMARTQLLRRLSANSNSTTASSRKGSMRFVKGSSGGTSPHAIQRRRTTASHSTKANHSMAQDNAYHRREATMDNNHSAQGAVPIARPSSWHPGSGNFDTYNENVSASEPVSGYTTAEIQGLAATSAPSLQSEVPLIHNGHAANGPSTMYEQPSLAMNGYGIYDGDIYPPYPSYDTSDQFQYPNISLPYSYGGYAFEDFQQPDWSQLSSEFTTFIPQQTPDFLLIQYPLEQPEVANIIQPPQINKKRSKELVGMGLYDNPERDIPSSLDYNHPSALVSHRESTGKGLKLEETWQPPQETDGVEDDGEEEEAYSTDEAEEDLPVAPMPEEVQTGFYPAYGDLSNQTFFFDNDDQYSSCIALDQKIPICAPKGSDAASENFLWF